ncbi:MAG: hypothetical protein ACJAWS_001955 [Oleiphilaceae bacterium]|jgi:probable lipoprotein NlpC
MKTLCASILLVWLTLVARCSSITLKSNAPMVKPPTVTQGMLGIVTRLLEQSQQWKGVKYRYGGLSTSGIDC